MCLTHWGRVTHICVSKLTITVSDNGLWPDRCQAIIWTSAGILLIGPLGTNFSEILIKILAFFFKKMRSKVASAKRQPFCLGLNVLAIYWGEVFRLSSWQSTKTVVMTKRPCWHFSFTTLTLYITNPLAHWQAIPFLSAALKPQLPEPQLMQEIWHLKLHPCWHQSVLCALRLGKFVWIFFSNIKIVDIFFILMTFV